MKNMADGESEPISINSILKGFASLMKSRLGPQSSAQKSSEPAATSLSDSLGSDFAIEAHRNALDIIESLKIYIGDLKSYYVKNLGQEVVADMVYTIFSTIELDLDDLGKATKKEQTTQQILEQILIDRNTKIKELEEKLINSSEENERNSEWQLRIIQELKEENKRTKELHHAEIQKLLAEENIHRKFQVEKVESSLISSFYKKLDAAEAEKTKYRKAFEAIKRIKEKQINALRQEIRVAIQDLPLRDYLLSVEEQLVKIRNRMEHLSEQSTQYKTLEKAAKGLEVEAQKVKSRIKSTESHLFEKMTALDSFLPSNRPEFL